MTLYIYQTIGEYSNPTHKNATEESRIKEKSIAHGINHSPANTPK
jgi:hypothetical protein